MSNSRAAWGLRVCSVALLTPTMSACFLLLSTDGLAGDRELSPIDAAAVSEGSRDGPVLPDGQTPSVLADAPFCVDSPTTIFAHGATGDDAAGDGSCQRPFRTITRALAVLRAAARTRWTVRLGGTTAGPVTYSTKTGETFPLVLDAIGWIIEGQSRDGVVVLGTGPATEDPGATIEIVANRNELRSFTITSPAGLGVRVAGTGEGAFLDNLSIVGCTDTALVAGGSVSVARTVIARNNMGINFGAVGGRDLAITDSEVSENLSNGVFVWGDTSYDSKRCKYERNGANGIETIHNAGLSSTDDLVSDNGGDGYRLGASDVYSANASILRAAITKNGRHGVYIDQSPKGPNRVRASVITGNLGAAVALSDRTLVGVDLGTQADPGNNTFAASTRPTSCGVINRGPAALPAVGNRWSACPTPAALASCAGGADVVRVGSGGAIDTSGCK